MKQKIKRILKLTGILGLVAASLTAFVLGISGTGAMLFESYLYDYKGSSVVMLTKSLSKYSGGTGFQIKLPSGKLAIMTNKHICELGKWLYAHTQDGKSQLVKVIEEYKGHDLCLMTPVKNLRPLKIARDLDLHERVWLVGHPALRPLTLESGHYVGPIRIRMYVSCRGKRRRPVEVPIKSNILEEFFKMYYNGCMKYFNTHHINNIAYGGNSGSPVINKYGNVIGVLFAGSRSQNTSSYIVPLKYVKDFLKGK